ncbi:hypothetical protein NM208_g2906 [Fusarium decemcellulare]|uniref:Uncharacterized protein n=1 Tax=Fusarium decemcellulare TaxID=57161 RepID=A0ACC1SQV7_9HYPO|nr:hypothetical protein NM208_g2906 [Fusarium decemcellulare]
MAVFCCRYLSSSPFLNNREPGRVNIDNEKDDNEKDDNEKDDNVEDEARSGYFSFLDYAAVNCLAHVQDALRNESDSETIARTSVVASVVCFVQSYADKGLQQTIQSIGEDEKWTMIEKDVLCSDNKEALTLAIEDNVAAIRSAVESRQDKLSREKVFLDLSGPTRFKCNRIHCSRFATGFLYKPARDKHCNIHQRPFRCTYADCFAGVVGYPSQGQLEDHCQAIHADDFGSKITFPPLNGIEITDLSTACQAGNLEEAKRFHLAEAQLYKNEPRKLLIPLYLATKSGHANICKYLIEQGTNPFDIAPFKRRLPGLPSQALMPMFAAIRQQNIPIIELYTNSSLDITSTDPESRLAYLIAMTILKEFSDGLELLLKAQVYLTHVPKVEQVMAELAGAYTREYAYNTRECSSSSIATTLIHTWFRGVFPNFYRGKNSTFRANYHDQTREPAECTDWKRSLFQQPRQSLHHSLANLCHPLSVFLLDIADKDDLQVTDEKGQTPLHTLARSGCDVTRCEGTLSIAQRMVQIDGGASANTPDIDGNLPINLTARRKGQTLMFDTLLKYTKNLNHKNSAGWTLIRCTWENADYLRVLVKSGRMDLLSRNDRGQTLLTAHIDKDVDGSEVMKILVEADERLAWTADNTRKRLTPLHYAMANAISKSDRRAGNFLLSLPGVENILRAFSDSTASNNADAQKQVREFARKENLERALEVMDRIGF